LIENLTGFIPCDSAAAYLETKGGVALCHAFVLGTAVHDEFEFYLLPSQTNL